MDCTSPINRLNHTQSTKNISPSERKYTNLINFVRSGEKNKVPSIARSPKRVVQLCDKSISSRKRSQGASIGPKFRNQSHNMTKVKSVIFNG